MSPERRTPFGVRWRDRNLGIDEWHNYPLNYHFFNDGDEVRINLDWEGTYQDGALGWLVGYTTPVTYYGRDKIPIGGSRDIILFDGDKTVTDLDRRWIKKR